jgi:hypothetical protein
MSIFRIQHEIQSLAQIFDPIVLDGYTFRQWQDGTSDPFENRKILAEKDINAETVDAAIIIFREELRNIINRLSFVTQCYMDFENSSFSISKIRSLDNKFVLRHIFPVPSVGLHLDAAEKEAFGRIQEFQPAGDVFGYLREATKTSSDTARFTMLIGALEAIAGENISGKGTRVTNKEYIRTHILKDHALYDELYAYGTGIRNDIFHGRSIDLTPRQGIFEDLNSEIYQRIRAYIIERNSTTLNLNAVHVPRTPFNNLNIWQGWLRPRDNAATDELPILVRMSYSEFEGATKFDDHLLSKYDVVDPA